MSSETPRERERERESQQVKMSRESKTAQIFIFFGKKTFPYDMVSDQSEWKMSLTNILLSYELNE